MFLGVGGRKSLHAGELIARQERESGRCHTGSIVITHSGASTLSAAHALPFHHFRSIGKWSRTV